MKHFSSWADVELMQQRNEVNEYDISGWKRILSDMVATFEQIKKGSLFSCWGVSGAYVGLWDKTDPCLLLKVDGAKHKGLTLWAYDEGADLYYLANLDSNGERTETHTEIYFDMVEGVLDELIERDPDRGRKMKQYEIIIMLSTGDEVHAQTRARGNAQAVDSILRNPAFLDFCKGATITKITVRGTGTEPPPDNNRFAISRRGDEVTAVDLDERLKVVFKVGDYNSNTAHYFGEGTPEPTRTAHGLRMLADWLQATHPELFKQNV